MYNIHIKHCLSYEINFIAIARDNIGLHVTQLATMSCIYLGVLDEPSRTEIQGHPVMDDL